VLRRIFGPNRDERIGGWRKLRNESRFVLFGKYNYNDHEGEDKMGGACSTNGGAMCI
jgi:hypothetical protein